MKSKNKDNNYIVRMRVTHIKEFYVEARTVDEAKLKAINLEGEEGQILDTPDWEVLSVRENT
jgi:hypothetical protein